MDYCLYCSIHSQVLYQSQPDGIEIDEGHAVSCRIDAAWTALECRKVIKFAPRPGCPRQTLDFWARAALSTMGREVALAVCRP